jgi:hypothetical protein
MNPGMIALEELEYRHKPALCSSAEAHFMAPVASQISVDRGRFSVIK